MTFTLGIDLISIGEKNGKKDGFLFIEQSSIQAYLVGALDCKIHRQLNKNGVDDYMDQLQTDGFISLEYGHVATTNDRPNLYFINKKKEQDWNIKEIIILNNFHNH